MKTFCTEFKAIKVLTGELVTFGGPNVKAGTWEEAQDWCHENAGHLSVVGILDTPDDDLDGIDHQL